MSRYVIIGAGAVGATVAAQLHRAGSSVTLVARGENLSRLRADGLRYRRPDGEHILEVPVVSGPSEIQLDADDVLVIAGKSQHTEAIVSEWAWLPVKAADGTSRSAAEVLPVITLQNGLENERTALRRFERVIGAVIAIPASHLEPGVVISPSAPLVGLIWLGEYPQGRRSEFTTAIEQIAADLRRAEFGVEVTDKIGRIKTAKLLSNLANALDAGYHPSDLRRAVERGLKAEAQRVLAAAGVEVGHFRTDTALDLAAFAAQEMPAELRQGSSTWQSLARHAGVETDFLNGEVVLAGRLVGRSAPLNAAAQAAVNRLAATDAVAPGAGNDLDLARDFPSVARSRVLVTAAELAVALADPSTAPVVLDVRWALGDPHGRQHYLDGHIPGARFVDLDHELAAHGVPTDGRHPLPSLAALESAARRWGINGTSAVVVYDNSGALAAARAWWLLRWAGVRDVRILDGGLGAWTAESSDLATGEAAEITVGDVTLTPGHLPVLEVDDVSDFAATALLLDARAGERYRGEVEPIDPRAGHIPGAVSAPTGENLDDTGRFRSIEQLQSRFRAAHAVKVAAGPLGGATDDEADETVDESADRDAPTVGVYCGSGVTAAHQIAALAIAGIDAALYPGSWSAWSSDPSRPAATGSQP